MSGAIHLFVVAPALLLIAATFITLARGRERALRRAVDAGGYPDYDSCLVIEAFQGAAILMWFLAMMFAGMGIWDLWGLL